MENTKEVFVTCSVNMRSTCLVIYVIEILIRHKYRHEDTYNF